MIVRDLLPAALSALSILALKLLPDGGRQLGLLDGVLLILLIGIVLYSALGVMRHGERVAEAIGEPMGTLVLTFAAVTIEVSLIATMLLHGEQNPTLARDTMFAILMIIMNGLVGLALLLGGWIHRQQSFNLEGARSFLIILVPLAAFSLVLPNFTTSGSGPALTVVQGSFFAAITLALYAVFIAVQTVRHRVYFSQPDEKQFREPAHSVKRNLGYNALLLVVTLIPVPVLAEEMASLLETAIADMGAPIALAGVIVAALVLAPEGLSAISAAAENRLQRSINILMGSALSTIALTVPIVILISNALGHPLHLGLALEDCLLLALTVVVSIITFGGPRTDVLKGAVHLVMFLAFVLLVFDP